MSDTKVPVNVKNIVTFRLRKMKADRESLKVLWMCRDNAAHESHMCVCLAMLFSIIVTLVA